ncbi:uncharacterized protein EAF01_000061 [Botrytis porri]|uniref:Ecp2 effector protein domain-containing protein n=1 Tax=Botrytis porri TaxID=87229 RepID=A0A4Z1L4S8_9HELO|nr:uncharacterized protein EAF01_000061 [Botrytis porri]KAF7913655.1 hypothetical protein EAF01_000061 [Botrytis porri]TGO91697.1 hypothetical protein BPOR_0021g00420 [Botrytis porri]
MYTSTVVSFVCLFMASIEAIVIPTTNQMRIFVENIENVENVVAYIGVSGVNLGCVVSDDNFPAKSEIFSNTGIANCWNWSESVTNLEVTWGDFDWISLYRGSDCHSSDNVTYLKDDIDLADGQSCHSTDVVRGREFVNLLSSGSILFGRGSAPPSDILMLPKATLSVDSVVNRLEMLRNGEL